MVCSSRYDHPQDYHKQSLHESTKSEALRPKIPTPALLKIQSPLASGLEESAGRGPFNPFARLDVWHLFSEQGQTQNHPSTLNHTPPKLFELRTLKGKRVEPRTGSASPGAEPQQEAATNNASQDSGLVGSQRSQR